MLDFLNITIKDEYTNILKNINNVFWAMYLNSTIGRLNSHWYTEGLEDTNVGH